MIVRRERGLLAVVVFAVLFAQVLLYPGIPQLIVALDAGTALDAGRWFLAVEFAGFILFAGVWGAASDALGRRLVLVVAGALAGAIGYAVLALLVTVDPAFSVVLAVRFLQGATTIGAFSLAMTMLMDLEGGHGRNMGAAGIAIGLGTALGAPVGGRLYALDVRAPLVIAAGVLALAGAGAAAVPDRAPDELRRERGVRAALGSLRRRPALGVPYAFGLIDRLTAGFFALVGTVYFQEGFGLNPAATGIMLGLFFAPFALLQYPFGVLSDRIGRTLPMAGGSLTYGMAVTAVGFAPSVIAAGALMVAVGVTGAAMAPATMALVNDLADRGARGIAMGGFNTAGSLGFLGGIAGGGAIAAATDFRTAFLAAGLLEVAIALVALPVLLTLDVDRIVTFGGE